MSLLELRNIYKIYGDLHALEISHPLELVCVFGIHYGILHGQRVGNMVILHALPAEAECSGDGSSHHRCGKPYSGDEIHCLIEIFCQNSFKSILAQQPLGHFAVGGEENEGRYAFYAICLGNFVA